MTIEEIQDGKDAIVVVYKLLKIIQEYVPPGGSTCEEAMSEIIGLVDPWPLTEFKYPEDGDGFA